MLLITSGAYVGHEIAAELGQLPAAFLPVGNRRLFSVQMEILAELDEKIAISVPEDYEICLHDAELLAKHGVEIIRVPQGMTLAESLQFCLAHMLPFDGPLRVLHGDTLIHDIPFAQEDVFSVAHTDAYYSWAEHRADSKGIVLFIEGLPNGGFTREVLSGYFCFSSPHSFLRSLAGSQGKFIDALNHYTAEMPLTPLSTGKWFDFGHLQTYYRSKAMLTTERSFNSLNISTRTVDKTSSDNRKIEAEFRWMEAIPSRLKLHVPALLDSKSGSPASYSLEYLYLSTLNELFVFGELPPFLWENIFVACDEFFSLCHHSCLESDATVATDGLYLSKTMERLELLAEQSNINLEREWTINGNTVPGLNRIAELADSAIPRATPADIGVMHGDFCFSNILYDFRHGLIKVIDPRGLNSKREFCVFGDLRYDLGKLHHSVIGKYDYIKADRFMLSLNGKHNLSLELPENEKSALIENIFLSRSFGGYAVDSSTITAISTLLFLSMLPLHSDRPDHQLALLANGLRLFSMIEGSHGHASAIGLGKNHPVPSFQL